MITTSRTQLIIDLAARGWSAPEISSAFRPNSPEQLRLIRELSATVPVPDLAKLLGVTERTIYRRLERLAELSSA